VSTQAIGARLEQGWPQWLDPRASRIKDGRDPLALETITTDRINPVLVPGILALSTRARYFSFHVFLVDEYARLRRSPNQAALGEFIRLREFEYAAAVLRCDRCRSSPVGVSAVEPMLEAATSRLDRNFSVESPLGGYGLYYRSPLVDLGLIAPQGSLMAGQPTPIDVLANERARELANAFRNRVKETVYYRKFFAGTQAIPLEVFSEYAATACLCRLDQSPTELHLLRAALLDYHSDLNSSDVDARRRAFALFLRLLDTNPSIGETASAFRRAVWASLSRLKSWEGNWPTAVGQWAALHGKEYLQEALRLLWKGVNEFGRDRMPRGGFPANEFPDLLSLELIQTGSHRFGQRSIRYTRNQKTADLRRGALEVTAGADLEDILIQANQCDSPALGAMVLLVSLLDRAAVAADAPPGSGWRQIAGINGDAQPGLIAFLRAFEAKLETDRASELLRWLVVTRILRPHDRIATAKLPDFTFRFRVESGRLRFYQDASLDFPIPDSRHNALRRLGSDLGLCDLEGDQPAPTAYGRLLPGQVFGD
jgi:hypothetical protein